MTRRPGTMLANRIIAPAVARPLLPAPPLREQIIALTTRANTHIVKQALRAYATESTFKKLQPLLAPLAHITGHPPYHPPRECDVHSSEILYELSINASISALRHKTGSAIGQSDFGLLLRSWHQLVNHFQGKIHRTKVPFDTVWSQKLLQRYRSSGAFTFRAPGLSDFYLDHMVLVLSVNEIRTERGPRVVMVVLDFDDQANSSAAQASREAASAQGLEHVSELSHEEAKKHGAEFSRVRFLDVEAFQRKSRKDFLRMHEDETELLVGKPELGYVRHGLKTLNKSDEDRVADLLESIYSSAEVEK
ncbi:MAG: hypothetical protein ACRYGK_08745 [Janthinobacterium lividum]